LRWRIVPNTAILIPAGSSSAQSDFIDLGKVHVIIVKIPAGTFAMGSDQVIHADDAWKTCPACAPRNEVEHPVHQVSRWREHDCCNVNRTIEHPCVATARREPDNLRVAVTNIDFPEARLWIASGWPTTHSES
jgi:hypothetical protein